MKIKAFSLYVSLSVLASVPTTAAPPASSTNAMAMPVEKKTPAVEKIAAGSLTLQQALAKPDATKLVQPGGKEITVGELRSKVRARELFRTTKQRMLLTGGLVKAESLRGTAKSKSLVETARQESAGALGLRTPQGPSKAPNRSPVVGIGSANGKTRGFVLSPGGNVTIFGGEFGDSAGKVNVMAAQLPGTSTALSVVSWRSDQIQAIFPLGLRGVPDVDVALQVVTSAGRTFGLVGGKFIATREDVVVRTNILRMVRLQPAGIWPTQMTDDGMVRRVDSGNPLTCKASSTDRLTFTDPGHGFFVTNLQVSFGRKDTGDGSSGGFDGDRMFFPAYSLGDWEGDSIDVRWGVWRDHVSPYLGIDGWDECQSGYQVAVVLSGPAGVAPF